MHTKHALWVLCGGLLAGCGDEYTGAEVPQADTDTDGTGEVPSPTGVSAGWDDETGTGEGSGGVGGGCGVGPACEGQTPFCVEGECVGCRELDAPDEACAATDPSRPVCGESGCVECGPLDVSLCEGASPVCGEDGMCRGCTAHDECETACDLQTGQCFDEAVVVGEDGGTMAGELSALLEATEPGSRVAFRLMPGAACALDTLRVDGGRSVAVMGALGERPCITSWDERAAITVDEGSALYLLDVRVEESYGVGVEALGGAVYLERAQLANNSGGAVAVSQDAYLSLRNTMLGGDRSHVTVLSAHSSTVDIAYSTIVAGFGDARGIVCDGDNSVAIRNSIVLSEASLGEIDCPQAEVSHCALEAVFGEGNVAVGEVDTNAWFVDYPRGELHLRGDAFGMPFEDVALWSEGDPKLDIDGDPRPATADAADWVGADIP